MEKLLVLLTCVVLVSSEEVLTKTRYNSASIDLCGPETEIALTTGEESSKVVSLTPQEHTLVCKLRVTAPKTHVINMQFIEGTNDEDLFDVKLNNSEQNHPPCVMSIFLPGMLRIPVWKGDLCSKNALTQPDLLTSDFKILWDPPASPSFTQGRKFVVTAVGRGVATCRQPGQHSCMRIGWDSIMCISDKLVCDGIRNCPKSATAGDEDKKLCTKPFSLLSPKALEHFAELLKRFENKKLFEKHPSTPTWRGWREWKKTETLTTTTMPTSSLTSKKPAVIENKTKATDSISQVLSKYGPWGYLMLGMLICGTVLMFCGLWECCFRKPKTDIEAPISPTQPTTVLIINQPQDEVANPPNYDELDQPPSYTTLFPNFKNQTTSSNSNSVSASPQEQTSIDISIPSQEISANDGT